MRSDFSGVIFDLDGTLLDTLDDIGDAVNSALSARGFATHDINAYRFFVGDGMETLVRRAEPEGLPPDVAAALYTDAKANYAEGWAVKSRPYPGIEAMFAALAGRKVPMAVLSNKPHEFTLDVVNHYFPSVPFLRVQGSPQGGKAKPEPTLALEIAALMKSAPENLVFMGDSNVDMQTANNAGMFALGALWGFRPRTELEANGAAALLEKPEDIVQYFGG